MRHLTQFADFVRYFGLSNDFSCTLELASVWKNTRTP